MPSELLRVRGGGSVVNPVVGQFNWSWPFVVLCLHDDGLQISTPVRADRWGVLWSDIECVRYTADSIVVVPKQGRPARFQGCSATKFESVLRVLHEHGVPMEQVRSTLGSTWKL